MQRASGALHLVHRVERRSMLKLRLVPGGKDGAAIGHGARCSVGSEWGSAVGGVAFGPPCASVSVNTAKARCCCRFTPTNPESPPSASRSRPHGFPRSAIQRANQESGWSRAYKTPRVRHGQRRDVRRGVLLFSQGEPQERG